MTDDQRQYVGYLNKQVQEYVEMLEDMFGPRDQGFVFGTVRQSDCNIPRTYYRGKYHTDGGCVVDIKVGKSAWEKLQYGRSAWQVAHECVHLLDPTERDAANFLEEGLATWFQYEPQFHNEIVNQYIARYPNWQPPERYSTAKRLVVQCQGIVPAVKKIRSSGARICEITPDVLAAHVPGADRETIEHLCAKFPVPKIE